MKNLTKAVASVGVATIGMVVYNRSITMKDNKFGWKPKMGIPGLILLVWGLQLSGAYSTNSNFSLKECFKPTK